MLLLWLPLLIEASNNSVIFPEEMGWFIIGFLVLYFRIVGFVCRTQNWFIVMWKICSFLEMEDGKDPLRASHYCENLLKDWLCPTFKFLCLLKMTQKEGLPPCCFVLLSTTSCNYELVVIQSLSALSRKRRQLPTVVGTMNKISRLGNNEHLGRLSELSYPS